MDTEFDEEIRYALIVKKLYLGKGPHFEKIYMFRPIEMLEGSLAEDGITFLNNNGREYYPIDYVIGEGIINTEEAYTECYNLDELYAIFNISSQEEIYYHYKDRLDDLVYIGVDHSPEQPGTEFDLKELNKKELIEYGIEKYTLGTEHEVSISLINELLDKNDIEELKNIFSSLDEREEVKTSERENRKGQSTELAPQEDDIKIYNRATTLPEIIENKEDNGKEELTPRQKIKKLRKVLKETIVGQRNAINLVCYALYKNLRLPDGEKRTSPLLIGPTGSGKTLMLETIEKELDIPTVIVDANTLSTTGYKGKDITDYLATLIEKAGGDLRKAEHGIVCIDEIDKKGSEENEDVGGKGVINQTLKFIEGCNYDVECMINGRKRVVHFNTKNLTVCLSGAFPEIYKQKSKEKKEKNKNTIGFNGHIEPIKEVDTDDYKDIVIKTEDISDTAKMGPEFAGRVLIVKFDRLTVDELVEQMENSKASELDNERRLLAEDNIILGYDSKYVRKIAEDAYALGTGGRGVRNIIEQNFSGIVTKIVFDDDTYDENKPYYIFGTTNEDGELSILSETGEELIERKQEEKKTNKILVIKKDDKYKITVK